MNTSTKAEWQSDQNTCKLMSKLMKSVSALNYHSNHYHSHNNNHNNNNNNCNTNNSNNMDIKGSNSIDSGNQFLMTRINSTTVPVPTTVSTPAPVAISVSVSVAVSHGSKSSYIVNKFSKRGALNHPSNHTNNNNNNNHNHNHRRNKTDLKLWERDDRHDIK